MNRRFLWWPMGPLLVVVGLSAALSACPSFSVGERRALLDDRPWAPPPWAELPAAARREVIRDADSLRYERARLDPAFEARTWRYLSDSVEVVARVYRPRRAGRFPAIVFCRGSWVQQEMSASLLPRFHRLASAGYVVVAPQYRGSEGGGGRDELGGADLEDVVVALRLAAADPGVRRGALYLYGESRGGMMVFQSLRDRAPVRAAATVGAFTDLDSLVAGDPRMRVMATTVWPEWSRDSAAITRRRSALRWADRLRVPLLILHGAEDGSLPPRQSVALAAALARLGCEHELQVVPGAGHTLGSRAAWRDSTVVRWFDAHRR